MEIPVRDISNLYIFGDSLSDTGNLFSLTFGQFPAETYFEGRLSNGPVAAEYWVSQLNSPALDHELTLLPSNLGGNNFATTGAGTGRNNSSDDIFPGLPGLLDQIDTYAQSNQATATDLFFVWAGPNDFLDYLGGETTEDPAKLIDQGVDNLQVGIDTLIAAGAEQFVVPKLLNLGRLPSSTASEREASTLAIAFNGRLALTLGNLALDHPHSDIQILEVDLFSLGEEIATDPSRYGLTNITDPLLPLVAEGATPPDTAGFFFWDSVHPTTQVHAAIGDTISNTLTGEIPQPLFQDRLGTSEQDFLFGTPAADNIDGLAGNDLIFGFIGSDRLEGWDGQDKLFGNRGHDILDGGADQDWVSGGRGNDLVFGGEANDWLWGNHGQDILIGDDGSDRIWGNHGQDDILGGAGNDKIWGNKSHDFLHGGDGQDTLLGGDGADQLVGGNDNDWVAGGRGDDTILASPGQDTLIGGLGNDTVQYKGIFSEFTFKGNPNHFQIQGMGKTHTLQDIESLAFTDKRVAVEDLSF